MYRYFISIMVALCSLITFSTQAATEYVDMGLPSGTLWANSNLDGAGVYKSAYYAWGETKKNKKNVSEATSKNNVYSFSFSWSNYLNELKDSNIYMMDYKRRNPGFIGGTLESKYWNESMLCDENCSEADCGTLYDPFFAIVSDNTNAQLHESRRLPLVYDVASIKTDGEGEIPSKKDFDELFKYTTIEYHLATDGFYCFVLRAKNAGKDGQKHVLTFPALGYVNGRIAATGKTVGYYWTSDAVENDATCAYCACFAYASDFAKPFAYQYTTPIKRFVGLPIRPIKRVQPYTRTTSLNIGIAEPTVELCPGPAADYGTGEYVANLCGEFNFKAFRMWVDFSKIDGTANGKAYLNKVCSLVQRLYNKGVKVISILPACFKTKTKYCLYYSKTLKKFKWFDGTPEASYDVPMYLSFDIPAPSNSDEYENFMEAQRTAYKLLATRLNKYTKVEFYFEGYNEPDGGMIMNKNFAGGYSKDESNKISFLNHIPNKETETGLTSNIKYNLDISALGTTFLGQDILAQFLVDYSKKTREGVKDANPKFKYKVLTPAFTTLGTTCPVLEKMYSIMQDDYKSEERGIEQQEYFNETYFDMLNIHPYLSGYFGSDATCCCKNQNDWVSYVAELQRICKDNGHNIPACITEMGYETQILDLEAHNRTDVHEEHYIGCDGDKMAADLLKFQLDKLETDPNLKFVETVMVFRMIDSKYDGDKRWGLYENLDDYLIDSEIEDVSKRYASTNLKDGYTLENKPLKEVGQMLKDYIKSQSVQPAPKPLPYDPELAGVETTSSESSIEVYPNPTNGVLHVTCNESQSLQRLNVMDATGRVVMQQDASGNSAELSLMLLQRGIYFVEIVTNEGKKVQKVLLQ